VSDRDRKRKKRKHKQKSPLPDDKGPTFDPSTHWCLRHLEPFRETWGQSASWVFATIALFDEMVRRREVLEAAGYRQATETQPERLADTRMLDRVMREFSPLCCYLGDEITKKWTDLALGPLEEFKTAHEEFKSREPEWLKETR
jgi:hypothetical protein